MLSSANNQHNTACLQLTEEQVAILDNLLEREFKAHFDEDARQQQTANLLELITETRIQLAQSLPCSECGMPRMGFHNDLCGEHYIQLTRGELRVRV